MEEQAEELQADRESDQRIAERLGLEVFEMWSFAGKEEPGVILDPDKGIESCPRYTTSLDAAIRLVDETPKSIGLELRNNIYADWWSCNLSENGQKCVAVKADPPALAICRAWWAWMDTKEKEE